MRLRQRVISAFRVTVVNLDEVRATLWTDDGGLARSEEVNQLAILEQYRIYVEMADRISTRRVLTNTFFLTLNTLVFATIGAFGRHPSTGVAWFLAFPTAAMLCQCAAWFWLLRAYRQLNSAKYVVIGALEERLPASPYWAAEWNALGRAADRSPYWTLTHLEQWIPAIFALTYLTGFIVVLFI